MLNSLKQREKELFKKILKVAMLDPKLPIFEYKNDMFVINKISIKEWFILKSKWKKDLDKKFSRLSIRDFESVEPCSSYLYIEIGYSTPIYAIRNFFFCYGLDVFNFKYKYDLVKGIKNKTTYKRKNLKKYEIRSIDRSYNE